MREPGLNDYAQGSASRPGTGGFAPPVAAAAVVRWGAAACYRFRMAFTPADWQELLGLLEQHPEWRAALRELLLGDQDPWAQLARAVADLAGAQRRTDEQLSLLAEAQRRTEARLEALAEAQRRTEERLSVLEQKMAELAEAQRRTEARLEALAEAQRRTEERLEALAEAQRQTERRLARLTRQVERLTGEVGKLKGSDLERRYRERAPAYFARLLRRIHALTSEELARMIDDAEDGGQISEEERDELLDADVVVRGLSRKDGVETYLAVEVSGGIGSKDVARAVRRAALLEKLTGKRALAVVAGEAVTREGMAAAREAGAFTVLDGKPIEP